MQAKMHANRSVQNTAAVPAEEARSRESSMASPTISAPMPSMISQIMVACLKFCLKERKNILPA